MLEVQAHILKGSCLFSSILGCPSRLMVPANHLAPSGPLHPISLAPANFMSSPTTSIYSQASYLPVPTSTAFHRYIPCHSCPNHLSLASPMNSYLILTLLATHKEKHNILNLLTVLLEVPLINIHVFCSAEASIHPSHFQDAPPLALTIHHSVVCKHQSPRRFP